MRNHSFSAFDFKTGVLFDYTDNRYPTVLHAVEGKHFFRFDGNSTYYVYVYEGQAIVDGTWPLLKGMYGSFTNGNLQTSHTGKVIIIERLGYNGVFGIGGPVEKTGRLKYIDGCTDSLLVPPVKLGDPCLNHLHFPPGIKQTMHTHPSMRVGLVASGRGECVTPFGNVPLVPGQIFIIHEDTGETRQGIDGKTYPVGSHCFSTFGETMNVIAWHPDSDYGPTDEEHPMLNRTFVDGVSAKYLDEIRTK